MKEKGVILLENGCTIRAIGSKENYDNGLSVESIRNNIFKLEVNNMYYYVVTSREQFDIATKSISLTQIVTTFLTNMSNLLNNFDFTYGGNFNGNFRNDLSSWDVENVTDMSYMFANSTFNSNLSKWDISSINNKDKFNNMFLNANNFEYIKLTNESGNRIQLPKKYIELLDIKTVTINRIIYYISLNNEQTQQLLKEGINAEYIITFYKSYKIIIHLI